MALVGIIAGKIFAGILMAQLSTFLLKTTTHSTELGLV